MTTLFSRSAWKPGCGKQHPDADAIIGWANGKVRLEMRHISEQESFVKESVWVPTDFPCFNPKTKEVRIRHEKQVVCTYWERDEGPAYPYAYVCDEFNAENFEKNFPNRVRATPWVPYNA